MRQVKNVDDYISNAPSEVKSKLREIRRAILAVAPKAEEKLSYGMPYYGYKGRLAYFAIATKHIGLYVPPPAIEENKKYLKRYETSKATIRFPLDKKLDIALIKRLVRSRMKYNESK